MIKHININTLAGLSRDWVGAKNMFMCVCFFLGVIPYGGEKIHKQNSPPPPKSRDNPVKKCLRVFFFMFFRSLQEAKHCRFAH